MLILTIKYVNCCIFGVLFNRAAKLSILFRREKIMTIEQRIENLEKELICTNRRNRILLTGVFLLVACLVLVWSDEARLTSAYAQNTISKQVRAKEFILEDEKGQTRAMLTVLKGVPSLSFVDENGQVCAVLVVSKSGPLLSLSDINGKPRVSLSVGKGGSLEFYDENEKSRAKLVESALLLTDENENIRAMLNLRDNGSGFGLYDGNGKTRAGITVSEDARFMLFDENGKIVWGAPFPISK